MTEIWVGAVSGIISASSAKSAARTASAASQNSANQTTALGALTDQLNAKYQDEWNYYQQQRDAANKDRGMAEFRKFSTVNQYAPDYKQDYTRETVDKPSMSDYAADYANIQKQANAMTPKVKASSGGLVSKIVGKLL